MRQSESHQYLKCVDKGINEHDEYNNGRIYCANCRHCKLLSTKPDPQTLRIHCDAGKWKKLGEVKTYKYATITRRYLDCCDAYDGMDNDEVDMGYDNPCGRTLDSRQFIQVLEQDLRLAQLP
jgi:hypothetical protein